MNNLVYFRGNSGWAYNCDSFLGYLVYFWDILAGSMIVIVSLAIEK